MKNTELEELRNMLIKKDKPLLWEILKASVLETYNLKNTKLINCYLNNINLPSYKGMTYQDSNM
jgi:hypothetical protein